MTSDLLLPQILLTQVTELSQNASVRVPIEVLISLNCKFAIGVINVLILWVIWKILTE